MTTIPLGSRPWVEAMSPKGDVVYAGLNANTIAVISTASDTVVRMIDTKNLLAESIIVSPDGNTLYVALADQSSIAGLLAPGKIAALSSTDGTVVHPDLTVGEAPAWITISPDGSKVFSLNFLSNSISVIDTAAWTVSTTVTNASINEPIIGGVAPNGTLAVTDFGNPPNVALLDTTTHQVTHTLKTSGRPVGIDFSPDGTRGYATVFGADSLSIAPDPLALQSGNLSSRDRLGPRAGAGVRRGHGRGDRRSDRCRRSRPDQRASSNSPADWPSWSWNSPADWPASCRMVPRIDQRRRRMVPRIGSRSSSNGPANRASSPSNSPGVRKLVPFNRCPTTRARRPADVSVGALG